MAISTLGLPVDIPWKLLAVSPDMMDTKFGNKAFPFAFRSSLAISAYEPPLDSLPEGIYQERLTYLKVSASVTGYQPTKEEIQDMHAEFPGVPTEELQDIASEYFACYGVLLNAAVFPDHDTVTELVAECEDFTDLAIGADLPNPLTRLGGSAYERTEGPNRAVDSYPPPAGDGRPELDLGSEMTVTLPPCVGTSARVVLREPGTREYRTALGSLTPGSEVTNPYTDADVTFRQPDGDPIAVVDLDPAGGDGQGELGLGDLFEVTFPASARVEVRLVQGEGAHHAAAPITVRAFRQDQNVATATTTHPGAQTLTLAADGIDRLVFRVPGMQSSLVEIRRYVDLQPAPVTMTAYAAGVLVGSAQGGTEPGTAEELRVDGDGIDRLVFSAPAQNAALDQLCRIVPHERPVQLTEYPHIVEFEPKTRDLYQAASLQGEVLTASRSEVRTDKTMSHTDSTETGLSLKGTYESPPTQYGKASVTGSLSHKWGETETDGFSIQADSARERRELQGTTTNLSQMYNLLTGYHVGTNRAAFVLLPRPHMLQPTDHRTFVKGLRMIEGIQDFFLVARRPLAMDGLRVEVMLDTGHFPEQVKVETPPPVYDTKTATFIVKVHADNGAFSGDTKKIESDPSSIYHLPAGWVVDRDQGDPGHEGVSEIANDSNHQANTSLEAYNYRALDDATIQVSGSVTGDSGWGPGAQFSRTYKVYMRSENPTSGGEPVVVTPMLITSRSLAAGMVSGEACPTPVEVRIPETPYEDFEVTAHAASGLLGPGDTVNIQDQPGAVHHLADGWVIDQANPDSDPNHPGIKEIEVLDNQQSKETLQGYDYRAVSDGAVQVSGTIRGASMGGPGAQFARRYRVFRRSLHPQPRLASRASVPELNGGSQSIVQERPLRLEGHALTAADGGGSGSGARGLLDKIHTALVTSWRAADRRPPDTTSFLDTDYFTRRIVEVAGGDERRERGLAQIAGTPTGVIQGFGADTPVRDALSIPLAEFAARSGLGLRDAASARRRLLSAEVRS